MSFFNLRRGGSAAKSSAGNTAPAESVEAVRKRARQRLIGAAVLVLLGVIGFPLIFDTQPRPVAVDIPIEIPSRTAAKPLVPPQAADAKTAPVASAPIASLPAAAAVAPALPSSAVAALPAPSVVPPAASLKADEEIVPPPAKPVAKAEVKPEPKPEPKPAAKPAAKPEAKPESKAESRSEAERAKALLEGKSGASADSRLVVQVGAFADVTKARDARQKLEKAGLKTYTQVAETKDGKRIRVRVGPYANKAEAEKAAAKIKALDLPAAILTL